MLRPLLTVAALLLASPAARAANACALHLLADLPVRYDTNTNKPVIDAAINGQTVALGLQLESPVSALTTATVGRLALPTHPAVTKTGQIYVAGKQVHRVATASIQLQQACINERSLPVAPPNAAWPGQTDGNIGLEMLRPLDIELDLPQHPNQVLDAVDTVLARKRNLTSIAAERSAVLGGLKDVFRRASVARALGGLEAGEHSGTLHRAARAPEHLANAAGRNASRDPQFVIQAQPPYATSLVSA